jgi:hypothetical protein
MTWFDNPLIWLIIIAGSGVAFNTAPIFWHRYRVSRQRGSLEHLLFDGTTRCLRTTVLILAGTFGIAIMAAQDSIVELVLLGLFLGGFLVFLQIMLFTTFRLGSFSFAFGDMMIIHSLARAFNDGSLDSSELEAGVRSIYDEVQKNNGGSKRCLEELVTRPDDLGKKAEQVVRTLEGQKRG